MAKKQSSTRPFVHWHLHSSYSLLEGALPISRLAALAVACKMPALALTDLFDLGGIVRFTHGCDRVGVRPIVGAELRVAGCTSGVAACTSGVEPAAFRLRLSLLCVSRRGYHNLSGLVTQARPPDPRRRPPLPRGLR